MVLFTVLGEKLYDIYFFSSLSSFLDSTFSEQHRFASSNIFGLTHCVPINNGNTFIGALCNNFLPTSPN
jgi:hypothetical protein